MVKKAWVFFFLVFLGFQSVQAKSFLCRTSEKDQLLIDLDKKTIQMQYDFKKWQDFADQFGSFKILSVRQDKSWFSADRKILITAQDGLKLTLVFKKDRFALGFGTLNNEPALQFSQCSEQGK